MSQLDDIKARAEGHTPGPWVYHPSISRVEDVPEFDLHRFDIMAIDIAKVQESHKDGELIAAAPKLLAALEAVQKMAQDVPRVVVFGGAKASGILIADDILAAIEEALS